MAWKPYSKPLFAHFTILHDNTLMIKEKNDMKDKSVQKVIASYSILSLILTVPLLIPIWLIKEYLWVIVYFVCFLIYMRIAINFAVRVTVMSSLLKELDAEKYYAIINAKPFRANYIYKLNLYLAIGDYQSAYNIISSFLLQNKNVHNRCKLCWRRCWIAYQKAEVFATAERIVAYFIDAFW